MSESKAVCAKSAASQADEFVLTTVFVPIQFKRQIGGVTWNDTVKPIGLATNFYQKLNAEIDQKLDFPSYSGFSRAYQVDLHVADGDHAESIRREMSKSIDIDRELERVYSRMRNAALEQLTHDSKNDPKSFLSAKSKSDMLRIITDRYVEENKVSLTLPEVKAQKRFGTSGGASTSQLGLLFLDRLRLRAAGWTVERAPFYQLSLTPGEVVTLRQRSFSKRATTLTETVEETIERRIEYSSTFATELTEQFTDTQSKSNNWNVTSTISGTIGDAKSKSLSASLTGGYGAQSASSLTAVESSREAETIVRNVESSQKTTHKTVIEISTEESLESETVRVLQNDTAGVLKAFLRRTMQVHHLSYERYGVRFCWSPCIDDPGAAIKEFTPGEGFFVSEVEAIKAKWDSIEPGPDEVPQPRTQKTVCGTWSPKLSGGLSGLSETYTRYIQVPAGFSVQTVRPETRYEDRDPEVRIQSWSQSGGTVTADVFVKLKGANWKLDAGNVSFRACIDLVANQQVMNAYAQAVADWRKNKADEEIQLFLESKRQEFSDLDFDAWAPSELQRRILEKYFNVGAFDPSCALIEKLNRIFEWEAMSATLYAPWWSKDTEITGLQSLATDFRNASKAQVYLPLRPGFEEEALTILLAIGALQLHPSWMDELLYYLADMRNNLEPKFKRDRNYGDDEWKEVTGPADIPLTNAGAAQWQSDFEIPDPFLVLRRFTAVTPTDGVDVELKGPDCETDLLISDTQIARNKALEAAAQRLESGDGTISVSIGSPSG